MVKIIMYHGQDCPHCQAMMPLVEKINKELNIVIVKKEVWQNEQNAAEMQKCSVEIKKACGGEMGVPVFINYETKDCICGELNYEKLKQWIQKQAK